MIVTCTSIRITCAASLLNIYYPAVGSAREFYIRKRTLAIHCYEVITKPICGMAGIAETLLIKQII